MMKRIAGIVLVALLVVASLTGCGSSKSSADYHYVYSSDIQNMDYLVTYRAEDHRYNANFVDGLLENDAYGKYVPCLASSYESNDDKSVWTFHLRKGVKWVTNEGEEYAELTAQDFVTALQHAADFSSSTAYLVEGVIKNFSEYEDGQVSFDEVGVKAVDDYTVEYTLTGPFSYFYSLTTYSILFPLNKDFLESKGTGCKLGEPVTDQCTFGAVDPTSILYNGGYILTNNTAQSVIELTKNANYWDKEHIYANKLTWTYDDGSDDHAVMNGFEDGTYSYAEISGTWSTDDFNSYLDKYKDNAYVPLSDSATFNVALNYNRVNYVDSNKTTDAEKTNTQNAIWNKNFRLALMFGFDRISYAMQSAGAEEPAKAMIRNTLTPPEFVTVNGESYGDVVAKEIAAANPDAFSSDLSVADGQDAYYDAAKCKEYVAKAKAEGISFPVTLDLVTYANSARMVNQANSLKKSVETSSDGQILINIVNISDINAYYAVTYYAESGAESDWDISTATGWSPDYLDPKSYLNIYSPVRGDMMNSVGLNNENSTYYTDADGAAGKKVGLDEYQALLDTADKIVDLNERYAAYAKADAWLIANAFTIPVQCTRVNYMVSKITPFTREWSLAGLSEYKFKNVLVTDKTVTADAYAKAKTEWEKKKVAE